MKSHIKFFLSILVLLTLSGISQADVMLQDTHKQNILFSKLKGKWVYINYWASWCSTCIEEIPEFNRFYQSHKHKNDPIVLYAVNFDALPLFEQKKLIKKFQISYPSLLKDPANDLNLGDIRGVPATFIFNPKGQLVKTLYGGQTAETLNQVLTALLNK